MALEAVARVVHQREVVKPLQRLVIRFQTGRLHNERFRFAFLIALDRVPLGFELLLEILIPPVLEHRVVVIVQLERLQLQLVVHRLPILLRVFVQVLAQNHLALVIAYQVSQISILDYVIDRVDQHLLPEVRLVQRLLAHEGVVFLLHLDRPFFFRLDSDQSRQSILLRLLIRIPVLQLVQLEPRIVKYFSCLLEGLTDKEVIKLNAVHLLLHILNVVLLKRVSS